jgi:transketolase
MKRAFALADRLGKTGKRAAIVSVHTLKPLDKESLAHVLKRYKHVIIIEECSPQGGLAMQVKQLAWEVSARCRIDAFTLQDAFIHSYGSHDDILDAHGLSVEAMMQKVCAPVH